MTLYLTIFSLKLYITYSSGGRIGDISATQYAARTKKLTLANLMLTVQNSYLFDAALDGEHGDTRLERIYIYMIYVTVVVVASTGITNTSDYYVASIMFTEQ